MCLKDADTMALTGRIWRERQQAPASVIQGPVYNVLDSLTQIGWTWTSFDTFSRPFFPPVSWLTCSKNWFAHQVRDGIRHAQLLLAKDRSKHFADYSYIDRHTSLLLLRRLLKQKQSYAHGTLKSIMANAVKTAVIFFKSKLVSSSTCPFCDLGVPESTVHMYEECPAWADIRNKFPQAFDARLLTCTRLMGIACLEQSTIDVMRNLHLQANNVPSGSVRQLGAASASTQPPVAVSACIACFTLHAFHPIWRRVGFSIRCTARNSDVDLALPLHGPEQCSIRAGALALCLTQRVHEQGWFRLVFFGISCFSSREKKGFGKVMFR